MSISPNISWYEAHRPKTVDDIVFSNEQQKTLVKSWIDNERIDGNVLLSGPAGTGKSTTAIVLIKKIIKNQADLCRVKSRSVSEIDEKIAPFVTKKPITSKSKIVYIEEIDRLSRQGMGQLKEDLMEKYQEYVSFIACSNHPKRIDGALLTRFTYKIDFQSDNLNGIIERLKYILDQEQASYDEGELKVFLGKNYKHGLRELINNMQVSYIANNGSINFQDLEQNLNIEDNVLNLIMKMLEKVMLSTDPGSKRLAINTPMSSIITQEYTQFVTLCHNNYDINYENIFTRLYESIKYLPLKVIISKYSEEVEMKKYPHAHLISCFYEMLKCVFEAAL